MSTATPRIIVNKDCGQYNIQASNAGNSIKYMSHIPTHTHVYTSSTAQGGGGSFKNRKPIGEVGCCESRVAEQSH